MTYVRRSQSSEIEEHPLPRRSSPQSQQTKFEPTIVETSKVYFVEEVEEVEEVAPVEADQAIETVEIADEPAVEKVSSAKTETVEASLPAAVDSELEKVVKPASTSSRSTKRKG